MAIPCYNEATTIAKVVTDFKRELPDSRIIVLNNRSTDNSADLASAAGAEVFFVGQQGKGNVVRELFRNFNSDICVLVDGDDTYPAESVRAMLKPVLQGQADMVVGDRLSNGTYEKENKRNFHGLGNALVRWLVNSCFKSQLNDIMSGYRAFSPRFMRNIPILSNGFEVETEMTINCLSSHLNIIEIPIQYRDRPAGSFSKLNTFRDGYRVLKMFFRILKDSRPLLFFGALGGILLIIGLGIGLLVIWEFLQTGWISHVPLAILATGTVIVSGLLLTCALILDTLVMHERQRCEILILRDGKNKS